jgi:predicted ester cyclase
MTRSRLAFASLAASVAFAAEAIAQTPAADTEARNADIIQRHHDAINQGDIAAAVADYAATATNNGNVVDRNRLAAIMQDNATTFPDWRMTIERLIAQGDEVAALIRVTGTHQGVSRRPVNGGAYLNVDPTGRSFSVLHTHWFVLKDGQIVEHRATRDDLGMSRQLGLLPPAPPRPPDEPRP